MQFSALLIGVIATAVSAQTGVLSVATNATVTATVVVESFTTYCPEPTTLTYNEVRYTVTEPTILTVTDCPCTITTVRIAYACLRPFHRPSLYLCLAMLHAPHEDSRGVRVYNRDTC